MSNVSERRALIKAEKKKFSQLHGRKKLGYIWDYYKLPIFLLCIALYAGGYLVYRQVTHREVVLYTAMANVAPGEEMKEDLGNGFLASRQIDPKKNECYLYSGLYLTRDINAVDQQSAYASQMKVLAAIDGEEMDVALMDRNAFDIFAGAGYLCDISELLSEKAAGLSQELEPFIESNVYVRKDNATDVALNPETGYESETEEYPMAINVSKAPLIEKARLNGEVYLGVIANSPRKDMAVDYISYLYGK